MASSLSLSSANKTSRFYSFYCATIYVDILYDYYCSKNATFLNHISTYTNNRQTT